MMTNKFINYKIIIIGESGVGKTSINYKFVDHKFEPRMNPTIGSNFFSKEMAIASKNVKLGIWDTAGQEQFRSIVPIFFNDVHGVMLVFDITEERSFNEIPYWMDKANQYSNGKAQMILVGNKCDLNSRRCISTYEAESFGNKHGIDYFETSCKTGANIEESFFCLAYKIAENVEYDQIHDSVPIITHKKKKECC